VSSRLAAAAHALGLNLDETAVRRFEGYRDRLVDAAQQFNLTTVRDPDAIEARHFLESIAFGRLLEAQGLLDPGTAVLDIGSGAGFPGLPLQIAYPQLRVTLLESLTKRCVFLQDVVDSLRLKKTAVLDGRAEEFGRDERYREAFDLVVARAVAPLPVLVEYALPFLRVGGYLAATKGSATLRELDESAAALSELGGEHRKTLRFEPPEGMAQSVILIEKTAPTPQRYPRRPGMATKRPIR
jgi:16S rRNA (guanine527-N7)-methyltransferase